MSLKTRPLRLRAEPVIRAVLAKAAAPSDAPRFFILEAADGNDGLSIVMGDAGVVALVAASPVTDAAARAALGVADLGLAAPVPALQLLRVGGRPRWYRSGGREELAPAAAGAALLAALRGHHRAGGAAKSERRGLPDGDDRGDGRDRDRRTAAVAEGARHPDAGRGVGRACGRDGVGGAVRRDLGAGRPSVIGTTWEVMIDDGTPAGNLPRNAFCWALHSRCHRRHR